MLLARKIRLRPSNAQRVLFAKAAGCARKAWNWALARKIAEYKATGKSPSAVDLHRELVILKNTPLEDGGFPWMYEVSKCAPAAALRDLDLAMAAFFRRLNAGQNPGFPKFKAKKHGEGHFSLRGSIAVTGTHAQLPRIGQVGFNNEPIETMVSLKKTALRTSLCH